MGIRVHTDGLKCRQKGGEKRKLASSTPGLTVEPNQKTTNDQTSEQASKPMNYQENLKNFGRPPPPYIALSARRLNILTFL